MLKQVPRGRVLFGSNAPFFYFESAALKLKESALGKRDAPAVRPPAERRRLRVRVAYRRLGGC